MRFQCELCCKRQAPCTRPVGKPFGVRCDGCRLSKKGCSLVKRKGKVPVARVIVSRPRTEGPSAKVLGKRKAEVVMERPSCKVPSPMVEQAHSPVPEAPNLGSSSAIPPSDPPAQPFAFPSTHTGIFGVHMSDAAMEEVINLDPVAILFENGHLRALLAAAYQDLELMRQHHLVQIALYAAELVFLRRKKRAERED